MSSKDYSSCQLPIYIQLSFLVLENIPSYRPLGQGIVTAFHFYLPSGTSMVVQEEA